MNLYLVRHAEAVPVGGSIIRDADRTLSRYGEEDAMLMGRCLKRIDQNVEAVVTSPLVRARQTAELLAAGMAKHPPIHVSEHLAPGFSHSALLGELISVSRGGSIVAVGHQPDMTMLISYLITKSTPAAVAMEAGAIACLHINASDNQVNAELRWLLTPGAAKSIHTAL